MILLVMVCQTIVYREVTALFALGAPKSDVAEAKGKDPWSKTLNWYFFAVTNYFLYGESLIYYFKVNFAIYVRMWIGNGANRVISVACRICRCAIAAVCNEPPFHQLRALHVRFRRFRNFTPKAISQIPIWTVLLGAHEFVGDCCVKVRLGLF